MSTVIISGDLVVTCQAAANCLSSVLFTNYEYDYLKYSHHSINIKGLSKSTDIQSLAGFLVSQTPLISSKRLPEIEQLLKYMLNRKLNKPGFQESLFLALTRVLRDDWRKSIELSTNIIYIFFCFSTFSDFHSVLNYSSYITKYNF